MTGSEKIFLISFLQRQAHFLYAKLQSAKQFKRWITHELFQNQVSQLLPKANAYDAVIEHFDCVGSFF